MDKDQLDGLMTLKLVAQTKSFSRAAEMLNVSHSAVSQIIKTLEERVGITLVSRTTRSISLTEAGERFLAKTGPAIDQILDAFTDISSFTEKPSGLLRLNLPRSLYLSHIEPLIISFTQKYPEVNLELNFEEQPSDIVKKGFDAGIRVSDILVKDMVAIKLTDSIKWVVAGAPRYFKKMGTPKHPRDLLSHNCIVFRFENASSYDRWEFEKKGKDLHVQVKGSLFINDSFLLKNAAIKGLGLIYSSLDFIQSDLDTGRLELVLQDYSPTSAGYYLYFPKSSQVLPKLRVFIDHIKANSLKPR